MWKTTKLLLPYDGSEKTDERVWATSKIFLTHPDAYMIQVANSIKKRMKDLSAILKFVASRFTNGQVH